EGRRDPIEGANVQFSRGFDYAVRSLVFLAGRPDGKSSDLDSIARTQKLPRSYLAKVMRSLVRGGIVTSNYGRGGGYILRRPPQEINLLDIYEVMEGKMFFVECMKDKKGCDLYGGCVQFRELDKVRKKVEDAFRETTLASLTKSNNSIEGNPA
ncbi:MAG: Rrf2 family transcriptional regulator, partial [Anaerolineales bacterium]